MRYYALGSSHAHSERETRPGVDSKEFLRLTLSARAVSVLPISEEIAVESAALEIHGDPADRLIAATAIIYNAPLVTCDSALKKCRAVRTVW